MPRISSGRTNKPTATRTSIQEDKSQSSSLADSGAGNEIRRGHSSLEELPKHRRPTGASRELVNADFTTPTKTKKKFVAENSNYINRYLNGKLELIDVSKVTTSLIRKCDFEGAKACFYELEANGIEADNFNCCVFIVKACENDALDDALVAFDMMMASGFTLEPTVYGFLMDKLLKGNRADDALHVYKLLRKKIQPEVRFFNPLISVLVDAGRFGEADKVLSDAVDANAFKKSLGYDKKSKTLDFHRNAIHCHPDLEGGHLAGHVAGVNSAVAATIFRRCVSSLVPGTLLVTGYHSHGSVKNTIAALMRENSMEPVPAIWPSGMVNEGAFVWGTKIDANLPAEPKAPSQPPSNAIQQTEPDKKPAFSWANRTKSQISEEASVQATSMSSHAPVAEKNPHSHTFAGGADRSSPVDLPQVKLFESGWVTKSLNPDVAEYVPTSPTS